MVGGIVIWFRALRAPFFTASAMSVVVGSAAAWHGGADVRAVEFALALAGVVALHAGGNLANDYYDHLSGNDAANLFYGPFSGGSRMIQDGIIPARRILRAAVISLGIGVSCAAALFVMVGGWWIPALAAAGFMAAVFYVESHVRLGARGVGEVIVGFVFGPCVTMGAYGVQAGGVSREAFWCGAPVGFLVMLILLVNEVPDYDADKAVGKNTLVVRLGRTRGVAFATAVLALTYVVTAGAVAAGVLPRGALWTLITAPVGAYSMAVLWRHRYSPRRLRAASATTILTHLAFTVILSSVYLAKGA